MVSSLLHELRIDRSTVPRASAAWVLGALGSKLTRLDKSRTMPEVAAPESGPEQSCDFHTQSRTD